MMADDDLRDDSEGLRREPASESRWQEQLQKGTAGCNNSVSQGQAVQGKKGRMAASSLPGARSDAYCSVILISVIPLGIAEGFSSGAWHRDLSAAVQRGWILETQMV